MIQLHPLSLLSGFGVAALAFLAMSQTRQPVTPTTAPVWLPSIGPIGGQSEAARDGHA